MKTKRTGEDPLYDNLYVRLKNESDILSPGGRATSVYTEFWDKPNCESKRIEYLGDEAGKFKIDGQVFTAIIPSLRQRLSDITARFNFYQDKKVEEGYIKPTLMPLEMQKIKSTLEARLDIALEELKKIEDRIAFFDGQNKEDNSDQVLKYGLECSGQLSAGKLVMMDGQICGKINGVVCITDKRSLYDGMAISDYRELAERWKAEIKASDHIHLKKLQDQAKADYKPLPRSYNSIPVGISVKKELLPRWPDGILNHYQSIMTRKKK